MFLALSDILLQFLPLSSLAIFPPCLSVSSPGGLFSVFVCFSLLRSIPVIGLEPTQKLVWPPAFAKMISKYSHIYRYLGLGLHHPFLGDKIQPPSRPFALFLLSSWKYRGHRMTMKLQAREKEDGEKKKYWGKERFLIAQSSWTATGNH